MTKTKKSRKIYLDYAAATPVSDQVLEAMMPFFQDQFYNPSAIYLDSVSVKKRLEKERAKVATILGCKPAEVIFTAGATESCNLAISGVLQSHPGSNMIISGIEHSAVYETSKPYKHKLCKVNKDGVINLDNLGRLIDDKTVLISVIYASNEIGTVQPLKRIARLIDRVKRDRLTRGVKSPLYLHSDASQAGNYLDLNVRTLGVDLFTLNGAKMYGPKQSGALYAKAGIELQPLIQGGGQEGGLRSGTENLASVVGFTKALEIAQKRKNSEFKRLSSIRQQAIDKLKANISNIIINGEAKKILPNIISLTLPGIDNERLVMELDERGVMIGMGSACSAHNTRPSRVLEAIGLDDSQARATLRISLGRFTVTEDLDTIINYLSEIT